MGPASSPGRACYRDSVMNPTQALISAIERDLGGIAVVWCPDLGLRDGLVDEVEGLAGPSAAPFRTASVDEAIKAPDRMALLVPNDELAVIDELEGRRDQLLADPPRTQPVVLFLLRDGDGRVALAKAPGLSSWVRGSDVDPDRIAEARLAALDRDPRVGACAVGRCSRSIAYGERRASLIRPGPYAFLWPHGSTARSS